jgi:hypothetical protein
MSDVDPRVEQAQTLFWEIETLRRAGRIEEASPKLRAMGLLHEQRALELLEAREAEGWVDLFAAITAYADAGDVDRAAQLLIRGRELLDRFRVGRSALGGELQEMEAWLQAKHTPPRRKSA